MSYYRGLAVKMIVKLEMREKLRKVLETGDWSAAGDPVFDAMQEEAESVQNCSFFPGNHYIGKPEDLERPLERQYDYEKNEWTMMPVNVFDPETGYWDFKFEYNDRNAMWMVISFFEYELIPYLFDEILEVRRYDEDTPGGFYPHPFTKQLYEKAKARKQK